MGLVSYFGCFGPADGAAAASYGGQFTGGNGNGGIGVFGPYLVALVGGFVNRMVGVGPLERQAKGAICCHGYLPAMWV